MQLNQPGDNRATSNRLQQLISEMGTGFKEAARITPEDRRQNLRWIRQHEQKAEAPRAHYTASQQPILDLLRQVKTAGQNPVVNNIPGVQPLDDYNLLVRGNSGLNVGGVTEFDLSEFRNLDDPVVKEHLSRTAQKYRQRIGNTPTAQKVGYAAGTMANDFINNSSRSVWWLINAPQAIADITSEVAVNTANPSFFGDEELADLDKAVNDGLLRYRPVVEPNPDFSAPPGSREAEREARANPENYIPGSPGVNYNKGSRTWSRRRYNPNVINVASMLPAALAVNAGIGLLGRREGYAATVPSDDDERKSSNLIAEMGSRYLLGREGRLLDQEDFLLERPDVSAKEYSQYKGYLRDRDIDLNPFDDGKVNFGGVLKTNPDGIRGAEVSFMGKSLPVNDTILPAATAIAGTTLGAYLPRRLGMKSKARSVASLLGGGMAGLAAGSGAGAVIEDERRRRNFQENNPGVDYDTYKRNAKELLATKLQMAQQNPNAQQEREKSKSGFSKRNQQAALQQYAQKQQALVDQLIDEERRGQAQQLMGQQNWALTKAAVIDEEIARRREGKEEQPLTLGMG